MTVSLSKKDCQDFSSRVLSWFYEHGRHDLPWQNLTGNYDPYPVWVSEIMLQQTQVKTVIGYYNRFMARFGTLQALAVAPLDEVIEHWAGLGYYARARNLHKTAQTLHTIYTQTGNYPQTLEQWQALSGIGRSTAGAIMAMGLGKFGVICDGNVKRVLSRHFAITDDISKTATDALLWQIATALTPKNGSGHYAQAMMDIGATLCTRSQPNCSACPINTSCQAHKQGNPAAYPVKAKKAPKPTRHSTALYLHHSQQTLWVKRPSEGIWSNLWCLPLYTAEGDDEIGRMVYQFIKTLGKPLSTTAPIRHTLTHFHWQIALTTINLTAHQKDHLDKELAKTQLTFGWYNTPPVAKPAVMDKLLDPLQLSFLT